MMRRWEHSANRARRYAPRRPRRSLLRTAGNFAWLRRGRADVAGKGNIVLHARVALAIGIVIHGRAAMRPEPGRRSAASLTRTELVKHVRSERRIRHAEVARTALVVRERGGITRELRVLHHVRSLTTLERARFMSILRHERLLLRTIVRGAQAAPVVPAAAMAQAALPVPREAVRVARHSTRVIRPFTYLHTTRIAAAGTRGVIHHAAAGHRRRSRREGAAPAPGTLLPPASVALPLNAVAPRGMAAAAAVRAFAVQPQPLAAAPQSRAPATESAPVERIERTLRESLTVVAERTVRREIQRTLAPGASASRRLRESIQSELADDIVFERERRGDR